MRPHGVILAQPDVDGGLSLKQSVEALGLKHFTAQCSIEPRAVAVLPWRAGRDMQWLDPGLNQPSRDASPINAKPSAS